MARELQGKRIFIRHRGHEFELPESDTAELLDHDGPRRRVSLRSGGRGGAYWVDATEERDDRITVTVGEWVTASGPAAVVGEGRALPEVRGYPFPSSSPGQTS